MKNCIASERANLFEPNVYIQLRVQIEGIRCVEELAEAVSRAYRANEATMSQIVLEENGNAYYAPIARSGCKTAVSQKSWIELIRENEKIPFALETGELMRVFVIPSGHDMELLIMAHHLAGDGKSIVYFLDDVMVALTGQELTFKPLRLITPACFPPQAKLPIPGKFYAGYLNRTWRRRNRVFTWDEYCAVHQKYWSAHTSCLLYQTFSGEELARMRQNAKKAGVSLNSLLITAFLRASPESRVTGIPVDIRPDNNRSMSNQVSGIRILHSYAGKGSFGRNAKTVHKKIYRQLNRPSRKYFVLSFLSALAPPLIDAVLLYTHGCYPDKFAERLSRTMGYTGSKCRDLGLTNLTRLDIPRQYGEYRIKNLVFIPPVVSYAKHVLGVSTLGDEMTVSYHFMNPENSAEEKSFFERGVKFLSSGYDSLN